MLSSVTRVDQNFVTLKGKIKITQKFKGTNCSLSFKLSKGKRNRYPSP